MTRCATTGKIIYPTAAAARSAQDDLVASGAHHVRAKGSRVHVYQHTAAPTPACGGWHVGHRRRGGRRHR